MKYNRTKNAYLNIGLGYFFQILILILNIIGRRVFLKFLPVDYLGIDGLFSNILTLLSLGELGLDTAATFSLYKPASEDNFPLLHSLVTFYRKLYLLFAAGVLVIGISVVPFLKYIVTSDMPQNELATYYVIFLLNTILSYFIASKVILLNAYQEQRIYKFSILISNLILQVLHIIVLYVWKNYYFYVASNLLTTLITTIILTLFCKALHHEVFTCQEISKFNKKEIVSRVFSTILYKTGGVLINGTDNILISALVSTAAVGLYSNYYTIINGVQTFISIISSALVSGIGNLSVQNPKREAVLFPTILLAFHYIASLGFVGFSLLINNLITIWVGEEFLFDSNVTFIIALNFYMTNAIAPIWMFREANGLFNETRYVLQIRALINIVLSLLLGKIWGVFGVLFATFISLTLTNLWFEPRILFRKVFSKNTVSYWKDQIKYCLITIASFLLCRFLLYDTSIHLLPFVIKVFVIICITSIFYFIVCFRSSAFKTALTYLKRQ